MDNFRDELYEQDEALALILASRDVPDATKALLQRISIAARECPQREHIAFDDVVRKLIEEYLSPKPAIAFASVLIVGVLVGLANPSLSESPVSNSANNFATYLYGGGGAL